MSDNIPTTNESEQYRNQIRKRLKK
ncbi:MAG: hypothetical protein RI985_1282, partial [Chloroflexota bacterium]